MARKLTKMVLCQVCQKSKPSWLFVKAPNIRNTVCKKCMEGIKIGNNIHRVGDDDRYYWRQMGFSTYGDYLKSPGWIRIRKRIMERDEHRCVMCGERATIIHHRGYGKDVFEGNADHLLMALCHPCHSKAEFRPDWSKRTKAWEKDAALFNVI